MQEHPIPQDITGYRFHIIGSMTIKQFGEVFLGVIVGVVLYSTNLPALIKFPLILLSVGIGAAMAFVPIEERPLDHWIFTFFKVLYRPTKYFWRRETKIPDVFTFTSSNSGIIQEPEIDLTPAKRQRIKEYLGSIPEKSDFSQDFTADELSRMNSILESFGSSPGIIAPQQDQVKTKPKLDIRVRSIKKPKQLQEVTVFDSPAVEEQMIEPIYDNNQQIIVENNEEQIINKTQLATDQVAQRISIPENKNIKLEEVKKEEKKNGVNPTSTDYSERVYIQEEVKEGKGIFAATEATTNENLPFPTMPDKPNKVVGMILSQNNEIITNAIVEIQTINGNIERAVKTNALGQFFITTPLKKGDYNVVVEKEGFIFQPLHLNINDEVLKPLEIRSTT